MVTDCHGPHGLPLVVPCIPRPSIGVYTCVDCGKPIEVRGDQCCHDEDHLLSGHPAVERGYWAADEVLEALREEERRQVGSVNVEWAADFLERRFSGEGAS